MTDWLTHLLIPSDKHNSRTPRARDLISSLTNIASSQDVPFHQLQQLQCLHHGATFVPLWSPILSSQPRKVTICGRNKMASVRDIKIDEALLILCLAYYIMKRARHCWNWGIMVFTYWDMGRAFHEHILHIFPNGWMDCRDAYSCCSLLIFLCNGQNIAEYEAYWLIGVPIIDPRGARQPFFLLERYVQINYYAFKQVNKQA